MAYAPYERCWNRLNEPTELFQSKVNRLIVENFIENIKNLLKKRTEMKKKLVIKFWKTEKTLAMQILEQEGLPKYKTKNGIIRIASTPNLFYETKEVYLRGQSPEWDYVIASVRCESNTDRDEYLNEITQAITDELFTLEGELKVGEICKVSNNENEDGSPNELIAILPKGYKERFIVKVFYGMGWDSFEYARPLCKRTEPKVETNGEIITYIWEEE